MNPPSLSMVDPVALLDQAQADFLTRHVSILVGSCNERCEPSVVRAYGCRVGAERRSVTVFLAVAQSEAVLRDLRAGGAIAAVFSRPSTHETVQLKGARASIGSLRRGDRERMRAYARSFIEELASVGYRGAFGPAIMAGCEVECAAVTFTPSAAFEQTPGPTAGQPLSAKS